MTAEDLTPRDQLTTERALASAKTMKAPSGFSERVLTRIATGESRREPTNLADERAKRRNA